MPECTYLQQLTLEDPASPATFSGAIYLPSLWVEKRDQNVGRPRTIPSMRWETMSGKLNSWSGAEKGEKMGPGGLLGGGMPKG